MQEKKTFIWRYYCLLAILIILFIGLLSRIFFLGIFNRHFLVNQSVARSVRVVDISAHRGMITDRNNQPLAISIPVASIWANPRLVNVSSTELSQLASLLEISTADLTYKLSKKNNHEFVYLKRRIPPQVAAKILHLQISGIFSQREYKRYYPEGKTAAQLVGFTNVDDNGQEGLELSYNSWLHGVPGKIKVVKDRVGNVIADLGVVQEPLQGRDLALSIDNRIQFLAYRALDEAVSKFHADSASAVVLDVKTGEVLAMVNQPSFNPNNRSNVPVQNYRNRAVTDLFEPGSTIKAFTVASALASGKYTPKTLVNTNPGVLVVDKHQIHDNEHINHGVISVTEVLQKSSDIGVTKMALSLPPSQLLRMLLSVGFGQSTQSGFPGEASGILPDHLEGRPFVLATLAFGYGISVTTLQLAQAYAVIATNGLLRPITFIKHDQAVPGKQVMSAKIAGQLLTMLSTVLQEGGTGELGRVPGYRIAGKTGTAHIAAPHGYYSDRYFSVFAGIAPVSNPRLVVAVIVKNPTGGSYYGGLVAAPTFAQIMEGSLRVLEIPPDDEIVPKDKVAEGEH